MCPHMATSKEYRQMVQMNQSMNILSAKQRGHNEIVCIWIYGMSSRNLSIDVYSLPITKPWDDT